MKISYAVPVCNELVELERLLSQLVKYKREQDEIVILFDSENGTKEVEDFLRAKSVNNPDFQWYSNPLKKDLALLRLIERNPEVEAYWVSRINTVNGLTSEHVRKWGWNVDNRGWVNFPDKQMRIYKNDPDRIKWTRPVHEQLVGYRKYASLPSNEEYCLHHPKDIKRQKRQNDFYEKI